ncbi:hypothetical protein EJ05DRAFT_476978 [Pseudovirgaria hyperparasitica]|uniref:Uncharacterized protein n=1 Tax=Pseudovirgaria hyperparasitica TaxID=470096 RepID=A0A6A6W859_9PEZI|nr:uncharacterized protein EJ05DRAFT_476978 [Pseudovirgaria hyperparasitica]KAF2757767.1 hypothetical protein EJ05DRAFT_476978 [Pseudovirgaria hyperparasitica]
MSDQMLEEASNGASTIEEWSQNRSVDTHATSDTGASKVFFEDGGGLVGGEIDS